MRIITNTNIIVDDFSYCKNYPKNTFIHFLTHFHCDHYVGLTNIWNYGVIYCSEITKKLILTKFPKVQNIRELKLNTTYKIHLTEDGTRSVEVSAFDSNHIPGSVMLLFKGYMGTILHTGDMRFCLDMIKENPILFPKELLNENFQKCSIHIDELIFDNTYLDPGCDFPTRDKAINEILEIIKKNSGKYVYLAMGTLGKEYIALKIAEYFNTKIKVYDRKYDQIVAIGYPLDFFTKDEESKIWIEMIYKDEKDNVEVQVKKDGMEYIIINVEFTTTNSDQFRAPDKNNYIIPYSQHSNFKELEMFIKAIYPSILTKLVVPFLNLPKFKNRPVNFLEYYINYAKSISKPTKGVFSEFKSKYTCFNKLSEEYKILMNEKSQMDLLSEFKLIGTHNQKKRKNSLYRELNEILPSEDLKSAEKKYFPQKRVKKSSFAGFHKTRLAVSQNKNITSFIEKKNKSKTISPKEETKSIIASDSQLEEATNLKFGLKAKNIELFEEEAMCCSNKVDYSKDEELNNYLKNFLTK